MEFFERKQVAGLFPKDEPPLDLRGTAKRLGLSLQLTKRLINEKHLATVDGPSVSGIKRYLADKVAQLVGRPMRLFETEDEALEWLTRGEPATSGVGDVIGVRVEN